MALFKKMKKVVVPIIYTDGYDEARWVRCPNCSSLIDPFDLKDTNKVCPKCGYNFKLTVSERIELITDKESFREWDINILPKDVLSFIDSAPYSEKVKETIENTMLHEAVKTGSAQINGIPISVCVFAFEFLDGTLSAAAGEKIVRAIKRAIHEKLPLVVVTASKGLRLQEGIASLFQITKIISVLKEYKKSLLPLILVYTNPSIGGVVSSFVSSADYIIAEKFSTIGLASPKLSYEMKGEKVPGGLQDASSLFERGQLDLVVEREKLKDSISKALKAFLS